MAVPLNNEVPIPIMPLSQKRKPRWESMKGHVFRRNIIWLLMALPALIWILVFKYLPLIGVWIAFTDFKVRRGVFGSEFVGFDNFRFLFATEGAVRATINTVALNILFIVVGAVFAMFLAWLLFEVYSSGFTKY